ncbi:MAG TPA: hypothetical protein VI318_22515 [Baekduia sp.]
MSAHAAAGAPTLRVDLERDRLHQRAARLDRVVAALRARARAYGDAQVPRPLSLSLAEFQDELAAVRARLEASPQG